MLPLELLKVIFGALSRNDLEALMLTNVSFRDFMLPDFAKEPLRYFATVDIHGHNNFEFKLTTGNKFLSEDDDDFSRRMRLARVCLLRFPHMDYVDFDENILNVLLPLKDAWRDRDVEICCYFPSPSLCERVFSELLFCKAIVVRIDVTGQLSRPFTSLPAIRECTSLEIRRASYLPLTVADIIGWVNADARSEEPRCLELYGRELDDSVDNLVQGLKRDFIESKTARRFVVTTFLAIYTPDFMYNGQPDRFVNKDTSEVLIIRHEICVHLYITVERMPLGDEKQ